MLECDVGTMAVLFAYDGSINGDWVSHYAIRLAAHDPERALTLVHVEDGEATTETLAPKLDRIERECARAAVALQTLRHPLRTTVAAAFIEHVPRSNALLVCGARVRSGHRGLLTGTVSEALLRTGRWKTVAFRVVLPGLLGHPREVLVPLAAGRPDLRPMLPLLEGLGPDLARIHVLVVEGMRQGRFRRLSTEAARRLIERGHVLAHAAEHQLRQRPQLAAVATDALVTLSDRAVREIAIVATRTKSGLVCTTVAAHDLAGRAASAPLEDLLREAPCDVAVVQGHE